MPANHILEEGIFVAQEEEELAADQHNSFVSTILISKQFQIFMSFDTNQSKSHPFHVEWRRRQGEGDARDACIRDKAIKCAPSFLSFSLAWILL